MGNANNYIWIFGENHAKTANDNSFYLWKYSVNIKDNIEKYLVLEKNASTSKVYNTLSKHEKKFVVWKNSLKHFKLFGEADLLFVNYSSKDVAPDKLFFKNIGMRLKKPFIHLQKGVCGLKKLEVRGHYYNNNILRCLTYNESMIDNLIKYNKFKDYQLQYAKYQPRYGDLLRKIDEADGRNQILWFLSDREYVKKDELNINYVSLFVKRVVTDEKLRKYLSENNLTLKVCPHFLLADDLYEKIIQYGDDLIEIVKDDVDLNLEIAKSRLLISDYSSIIYDFSFIKRPYIIFQPDLNNINKKKDLYKGARDLSKLIITRPDKFIDRLTANDYETFDYIEEANNGKNDFDFVKRDGHLEEFYNYFRELQLNKITFLGYNFYGIGGTVNATMALADCKRVILSVPYP